MAMAQRRWWRSGDPSRDDSHVDTLLSPKYTLDSGEVRRLMMDAMDGTITAAGVIEGLIASGVSERIILIAGTSAIFAGGLATAGNAYTEMAAERDSIKANLAAEARQLDANPEGEREELIEIYVGKGLDRDLAEKVVEQLNAKDALAAHIDEELHLTEDQLSLHPPAMSIASFLAYAFGALIPIIAVWLAPTHLHTYVTASAVIGSVALIAYIAARTSHLNARLMVLRTVGIAVGSLVLGYVAGLVVG